MSRFGKTTNQKLDRLKDEMIDVIRTFTVPMRTGEPLLVQYEVLAHNRRPFAVTLGTKGEPDPTRGPYSIVFHYRQPMGLEELPMYLLIQMVDPLAFLAELYKFGRVVGRFNMPARLAQTRGMIDARAPLWFTYICFTLADDYERIVPSILVTGNDESRSEFAILQRLPLLERLPSAPIDAAELEHERLQLVDQFEYWTVQNDWLNDHLYEVPLAPRWQAIDGRQLGTRRGHFQGPAGTFRHQYELILRAVFAMNGPRLAAPDPRANDWYHEAQKCGFRLRQPATPPFPGFSLNVEATDASGRRLYWHLLSWKDWLRWSMATERLVELVLATRSTRIPAYCLFWIVEWLPFGFITPQQRVVAFFEKVIESVTRVEQRRIE